MAGAITVTRHGGPEVLTWTEVDPGAPGAGEARVRHTAVGLNFIDVYHRSGLYPIDPPFTPGSEAAGVVEAVGPDVTGLTPGDRVAYAGAVGAYCEARVMDAARLVPLPDAIDDVAAASIMLKGCTVEYLVRRVYPVGAGTRVLLHAAAGGVGSIASQWLRALGATVIGTAGTEAKAQLAREHGCDHVILYRTEDVAARVRELTDGAGVDVVYDSVGKDTFLGSLDALRPRGMLVTFGNASGPVDPMAPLVLASKGSLFLTRPRLGDYYTRPDEIRDGTAALFDMVTSGRVHPPPRRTMPLRDAAQAHRELEARETTGATVFIP